MSSSRVFLVALVVASLSVTLLGVSQRDVSVARAAAARRSISISEILPAPVRLPVEPYESDGTVGAVGSEGGYWAQVAQAATR